MLEADLKNLPWQSGTVEDQGEDSEVGPDIYHFHSDNPDLPELLVTVYKGKVTEVNGGAEGTTGPNFVNPIDPANPAPGYQEGSSSWSSWLFDLLFKK
jgi:hypothetical protein